MICPRVLIMFTQLNLMPLMTFKAFLWPFVLMYVGGERGCAIRQNVEGGAGHNKFGKGEGGCGPWPMLWFVITLTGEKLGQLSQAC